MTARRGFTLLEVMVALLVTSLVVGLGYATLASAMDTQSRTADVRRAATTRAAAQALLGDALRHAVEGEAPGAQGWQVTRDASGGVAQWSFVTRGLVPPLGASGRWQVRVTATDARVRIAAVSLDEPAAPLFFDVPDVAGLSVAFRAIGEDAWRDTWDDRTRLPQGMVVTWRDGSDRAIGAPLVVRTAPVGSP